VVEESAASVTAQASGETIHAVYLPLLVMLVVGGLLVVAMFTGNRLLRPTHDTREKLLTYECGVDPVGEGWAQHHVRYYVFAYLYVIFAVDAVFLFPWATVFGGLGWVSVGEMGVFIGFIAVGLVYAWRKGVLTWT
jgi:NADH-quinone oxidoreductase subunit A